MRTSPIDLHPHEIAPVQEGMQTQVRRADSPVRPVRAIPETPAYVVVDLRTEWTRRPYISFWGADSAGYYYCLPKAGRYAAEELDQTVGYHTRRRYSPTRKAYTGPWEGFGVAYEDIAHLATTPDEEGRGRLYSGAGPVIRNTAAIRKLLTSLRYRPAAREIPTAAAAVAGEVVL